jgi:putative membrane protein
MQVLWNILLMSVVVFVVASFMPTIKIKNFGTALLVAVVYSLINFFVGWLLLFLAIPFIFITFGLFIFVVNAALLWMTDKLIEDFEIEGLCSTLIAAVLISIFNSALRWLL